jgi:subtilisin family serine protease/subtilisin-like proprotein convertase family protein
MSDLIPSNIFSTAKITVGSSVNGRIDFNGDKDWYGVQLYSGFSYQIFLEGSSSGNGTLRDPFLVIRNASGALLDFADDISLSNWDAYIHFSPSVSGTYFISAEESGNNATGSYVLTVWQDQLASISTAATISVNTSVTDRLGWGADFSDWYAVQLIAGVNYQFDVTSSALFGAANALVDPFLFLRNNTGAILLGDDDSGNGLNSRIFFTPTVSGTYFLDVQESGLNASGVYSLIVNESPVVGTIILDAPWDDLISFRGDNDLFAITLTSGISYGFSINGGTLADPFLELMNSNGAVIASDDDSGIGLNSQISFTSTNTGTYFLAARAVNNSSTGSYTALAWELPSISIEDAFIEEGNTSTKPMNFLITLSKPSPVDVVFAIGTRAGTASSANRDYEGIWETTLTIPAGQTSITFSVPIVGDTEFEPDEGFGVVISNAVMATIANGEARGWIIDDDAPYPLPSDSLSRLQWHLYPEIGANVFPVWDSWRGEGIKVAVFDQGIDSSHPDLKNNILVSLGRNAFNLTSGGDPVRATDNHGTAVAGVIAAEANHLGVIGVAPKASLISIYSTLASSPFNFSIEVSNAFAYAKNFDVLNNSWGFGNLSRIGTDYPWAFFDNFRTSLFSAAGSALQDLAENGRQGLGTVVVQSAGNSYGFGGDTNLHNFQNSRYIITVAGTDYQGNVTSYSSPGASVLIAAPGGEINSNNDILGQILTTDRVGNAGYHNSDYNFVQGTSFSGPVVSGIVALMLEANPLLGYRDVQQIIAYSGKKIAETENAWKYNGAAHWNGGGLHYDSITHNLGFGLIDALTAVRLAETWSTIPQTSANVFEHSLTRSTRQAIPDGTSFIRQSVSVTQAMEIERVEVTVDITHGWLGDLSILLTSPAGTSSWLLWRAGQTGSSPYGQSQDNINFTFNTVLSWGEGSEGIWTLSVFDQESLFAGTLNSWTLNLIGKPVSDDSIYVYTNEFSESVADQTDRATLIDSGGIDQINASAVSTDTFLNLQPGSQSRIDGRVLTISVDTLIENAVTGDGNDTIVGNQADNYLRGMRGNDSLYGGDGDDILEGGQGNDFLDGGQGIDRAIFNGPASGYKIEKVGADFKISDIYFVNGNEGVDLLRNIEEAQFTDGIVILYNLDFSPPLIITFNPENNATAVTLDSNIVLTFNEAVVRGKGMVEIRSISNTGNIFETFDVAISSRLIFSGTTLTIDPTTSLGASTKYFVTFVSGSILDIAGNNYAGTTTYAFTTAALADTVAPTIALSASKASLIAGETAILTFTLSEASTTFTASDVTVTGGTLSNFVGSGTTYTALFTPTANSTTSGVVRVASGVFTDAAGNANADGSDANNTVTMTVDTMPVLVTKINTLSVIVDKGVLGNEAVLLKDLKEITTTLDGRIQSHTVEYAGVVYGFEEINPLITTVTRDGEFTQEFRVEIAQAYPGVENILYVDAVAIVGIANIDQILLGVAGFDGDFVN